MKIKIQSPVFKCMSILFHYNTWLQSVVFYVKNDTCDMPPDPYAVLSRVRDQTALKLCVAIYGYKYSRLHFFNPRTPRGGGYHPLAFFPCNFFDDSNGGNRLIVSVTRDGRHILAYVTSSWRCHVTYVMTSYVHDGGQNTLFLPLFVNRNIFWCRCNKVMWLVSFSTKLRS